MMICYFEWWSQRGINLLYFIFFDRTCKKHVLYQVEKEFVNEIENAIDNDLDLVLVSFHLLHYILVNVYFSERRDSKQFP